MGRRIVRARWVGIRSGSQEDYGKPARRLRRSADGGRQHEAHIEQNVGKGGVMSRTRTLLLSAVAALVVAAPAGAGSSSATITISHQMRGCHMWQLGNGQPSPTLNISVKAGTVLRFVNNDVMPHKLIQLAGPKLGLKGANMNHMSASTSAKLARKGVYRFTTKPGEDYKSMASMKTVGEDYVLHLTVHVK
jgi:plastocyanin